MERVVEQEWLDALPAEDPAAVGARRDLRRINFIMGSARQLARLLPAGASRIAELGAGDGRLMLRVARTLRREGLAVTLVDRTPAVDDKTLHAFAASQCSLKVVQADVHDFLERAPRFDAIIANLFLHHFEPAPLARLLQLVAERTAFFAACEPRRSVLGLHFSRLTWMLGCNAVTRHDAVASVRAGFAGVELSEAWPGTPGWRLEEHAQPPFSHVFTARRADA